MYKYIYDGPVMVFNQLVTDRWVGETLAVTKRKARSNLMYQCKQALGLSGSAAVISDILRRCKSQLSNEQACL